MLCYNALLADNHILPVRPVLIVDEAHQLTRYAIGALTMALEHDQFWGLINGPTIRAAVDDPNELSELRHAYDGFFHAVARQRPDAERSGHRPARWALAGELQPALDLGGRLRDLQRIVGHASGLDEADQESALMQLEELALTTQALAVPEPETHIRLCEMMETGSRESADAYLASYRPLEVGGTLRHLIFDTWPRVICTSATLSVANDLGWYRRRVGLFTTADRANDGTAVISETLDSPFDYPRQVLLYTPKALTPIYNEKRRAFTKRYVEQLTEEVRRLLETSRGRALVLCTSRARMVQLYDTLAITLQDRFPCYLQGELSQPELVRRFKRDGNAILFATRGFWEGLDIPGDALALVILDKIPFVPYNDPVIRKQEAQIKTRGGNPFYDLQLGTAILNLRQGAGRLIRSETDRGVIALLDGRVLQKAYGHQIIQSLPEGCHTTSFDDVAAFLKD
jgi:Rad3-related DNA helicase